MFTLPKDATPITIAWPKVPRSDLTHDYRKQSLNLQDRVKRLRNDLSEPHLRNWLRSAVPIRMVLRPQYVAALLLAYKETSVYRSWVGSPGGRLTHQATTHQFSFATQDSGFPTEHVNTDAMMLEPYIKCVVPHKATGTIQVWVSTILVEGTMPLLDAWKKERYGEPQPE